jgi:thiol-disulfide isomerase/thioredoxin
MASPTLHLPVEGRVPPLTGATGWLNSPPLRVEDLRGRVVLVQFWTYTCINWLRTLPHVRAWEQRYRDQGLVVIGVHTPEFPFERDPDNVRRAVAARGITYPVALDAGYAVWDAFANRYWPALYLVDARGRIRHHHFGEGDEERSERVLQELLREAGADAPHQDPVAVEGDGPEAAADWDDLGSPETYTGYEQTEGFASPGGVVPGARHAYALPERLPLNSWALAGEWTVLPGSARLDGAGGRIAYRFHARDLHLVMGPAEPGTAVRYRVLVDGAAPGAAHGSDVDPLGSGTVTDQRLHQLLRQPGPVVDRQFEIEFTDPGVEAFVFTFG